MEGITKLMNKIKFQSFGKVKISQGLERNKELDELYKLKSKAVMENNENEANNLDEKIGKELLVQQRIQFEKKLKDLSEIRKEKGASAAVFKLKENILGSKKVGQEAVSMEDPQTGNLIMNKEDLKKASIKYVSSLLTNRNPKDEYKEEFEIMESLHEVRAQEEHEIDELTETDFRNLIKQLTKKNKEKYQFILKAGKSYQNLLFQLYRKVWNSETKPTCWKKTVCHQLYKGKGDKKEFSNQRFIHTKEDIPKAFEQIVINRAKHEMVKNVSKYQIGAIPGHQPAEHLFTIKSIISFYNSNNVPLIFQGFDIRKYFDSENLKDARQRVHGIFTSME